MTDSFCPVADHICTPVSSSATAVLTLTGDVNAPNWVPSMPSETLSL